MRLDIMRLLDKDARSVLEFWFNDINKKKWFLKNEEFDQIISQKFMVIYNKAINGIYDDWILIAEELLALVIIFDQFSRNMFRGNKQSFATDEEALLLTHHAIKYNMDNQLHNSDYKHFLYMPLMHSENIKDQELSISLFSNINYQLYKYAVDHHNIIEKFGRFPHRNKILGRESTKEEILFLGS